MKRRYMPDNKVSGGVLAGALTVLLIYILQILTGIDVPGEVGSAITVIFTFITSYLISSGSETFQKASNKDVDKL